MRDKVMTKDEEGNDGKGAWVEKSETNAAGAG